MLIALVTSAFALSVAEVPNPRSRERWVSDVAGIVDDAAETRMNERIERLHRDMDVEIAVVTVPSVDSSPKVFATELFDSWGIGDAVANNGLLVLLVVDDRRLEMETGYGLEPVLPDGWLGSVQATFMVPSFRAGDFGAGLEAGLVQVDERLRQNPEPSRSGDGVVHDGIGRSGSPAASLATPAAMTIGGGGALGLGALGLVLFRRRQRTCPTCKVLMPMISEEADDAHLTEGQKREETLGSVDHQIYQCERCGHIKHIPSVRWFSGYSRCGRCNVRALTTRTHTIHAATQHRGGLVEVTETCHHCTYRGSYRRHTPALPRPSSHSSSSRGSFGGGRGGGGFGGGRSGGGGAGSSW